MQWPSADYYQEVIQNPSSAFDDPDMKNGTVETMLHGLPKPYAGNFTTTYHLQCNPQDWAVRCFTRDIPDLQEKYSAIGSFIRDYKPNFLVDATCLTKGIRVNNSWYPVIKMKWVEGLVLNQFISDNIADPHILKNLGDQFVSLSQKIKEMGLGHGDLQHGNILVKNGQLYLVDYDGMYLPSLSKLLSNEIGHPNYQHPMRDKKIYDEKIDRFSLIVIWFSLKALSVDSTLWKNYHNGDNLIFCRNDYLDPVHSSLFSELITYPQLKDFIDRFKGVCFMNIDQIPTLDQFIAGNFTYPSECQYSLPASETVPYVLQKSPVSVDSLTGDFTRSYPSAEINSATAAEKPIKSNYNWIIAILLIGFIIFSLIPMFPKTYEKQEAYQTAIQVPYDEQYQSWEPTGTTDLQYSITGNTLWYDAIKIPVTNLDNTGGTFYASAEVFNSNGNLKYSAQTQSAYIPAGDTYTFWWQNTGHLYYTSDRWYPHITSGTKETYGYIWRTRTAYKTEYQTKYRTVYDTKSVSLIQLLTG
jgi:hypothetical protein